MPQIKDCKVALVTIPGAGTITLVTPGTSPNNLGSVAGSPVGSVYVWQISGNAAGATSLQFNSNVTPIGAPIVFTAAGAQVFPYTGAPWFRGAAGQPLTVTATGAGTLTGEIYYTCE